MPKLKEFEVVRTPKIRDSEGNYIKRGAIAKLDQPSAEHYHALGYIRVTMDDMFNDKDDSNTAGNGADTGSDGAETHSGPSDPESVAASGEDDTGEAGEDDQADAGTDQTEETQQRPSVGRRKRASR